MGDLESLLCALAVIYLFECLVWVQRGSVLLLRWWGKSCAIRHPNALLGNTRGAALLANPFPPLGAAFLGRPIPVSYSAEGALSCTAACLNRDWRRAQVTQFVRFDALHSVEVVRKTVLLNGTEFFKAASPYAARKIAEMLDGLRKTSASDRPAAIREMVAAMLDRAQALRRVQAFNRSSRWLRFLGIALFFYLFAAAPWVVWRFGLAAIVWPLVAGLLAQTVTISILFRRAHASLYPEASEERFTPFLTMLLAPPTAIRAADILGRPLLEHFHALAAAAVVTSKEEFAGFSRQILLDLRYPILPACSASDPSARATEKEFRQILLEASEALVTGWGIDVQELLRPSARTDPTHRSYCPRCETQFTTKAGACADCGGRELLPFPDAPDE
jgi:hypothetical protein